MSDRAESIYTIIGHVLGALTAVVTFIWVYYAAVQSVGWVIGIALGWVPASLASLLAGAVAKYLWLPAILLIAAIVLNS